MRLFKHFDLRLLSGFDIQLKNRQKKIMLFLAKRIFTERWGTDGHTLRQCALLRIGRNKRNCGGYRGIVATRNYRPSISSVRVIPPYVRHAIESMPPLKTAGISFHPVELQPVWHPLECARAVQGLICRWRWRSCQAGQVRQPDRLFCAGELGLTGEVRSVPSTICRVACCLEKA